MRRLGITLWCWVLAFCAFGQTRELNSSLVSGFKFRSIGPALTSGRIVDIAVNPNDDREWYIASASGGVWKTSNAGNTFQPLFDGQGSYSIGCVTIDPNNEHVIWVGSGENNNQRSVAYGDGVYKSEDGGKSWKNMGLKESEHIGMITVDPRNSNTIYVAAYGPLWSAGGERGLYKSTDGGSSWNKILEISENTGVSEVHLDPRNPDLIYATAHQRRRHVFTYLGGGPESAIYKSSDGGKSFDVLAGGLPSGVDIGRIGMDISPANPDVVYAIVEAQYDKGGVYKSTNRGASWNKVNKLSTSGNYYQEIICDPLDEDRLFFMDTYASFSEDGGKTVKRIPNEKSTKHVDDHCIWIDPSNTDHWIMGCDGGIYETWDAANAWHFKPNLPVTQFYKVAVDNAEPFYNVYGGTQDNFSLGGPAATNSANGILNSDWFVTNGGDGFESQIDPTNPNIVYAQAQYGWLVRYDRQSGEKIFIQPVPGKKERKAYRWNWDAPLLISPHSPTRLYFAANKLFKSDDRGDTWQTISPDLSRQLDRNTLSVMGKVWSVDAVMKNKSTTIFGNIVALDESPKKEGLLYVGTDDGLIQVSEDGGRNWTKQEKFKDVPEMTYVNMIIASQHDENVVYAVFNNHKKGDFKPYVLKSTNKGKSWSNISSDLPERGSTYAIAEDHVDPNLLFVGTEFGVFYSNAGGDSWIQLKSGLPTIAVRDIAIQKRENDLVLGTFGRGFYVLDDYSPLRSINEKLLESESDILPIEDALMFVQSNDLGRGKRGFQGGSLYSADNPPVGAVITYYLKDGLKTRKQLRKDAEKESENDNYPDLRDLRKEDLEEDPFLIFTITDAEGNVVRKIKTPAKKGVNRIVWDFKYSARSAVNPSKDPSGRWALPGTYTVSMEKSQDGRIRKLRGKQKFECVPLNLNTLTAEDKIAVKAFVDKAATLRHAVDGANKYRANLDDRIKHLKQAVLSSDVSNEAYAKLLQIETKMAGVNVLMNGDATLSSREFETMPTISWRINMIVWYLYNTTSPPTKTFEESYEIAYSEMQKVLSQLQSLTEQVESAQKMLDDAGAPWTPGRLPKLD